MTSQQRELRIGNIGGHRKGWAVINSKGPYGDDIVAAHMTERDAQTFLDAEVAADERQAAIVAWLRENHQQFDKANAALFVANAIEAGEWKGQG